MECSERCGKESNGRVGVFCLFEFGNRDVGLSFLFLFPINISFFLVSLFLFLFLFVQKTDGTPRRHFFFFWKFFFSPLFLFFSFF